MTKEHIDKIESLARLEQSLTIILVELDRTYQDQFEVFFEDRPGRLDRITMYMSTNRSMFQLLAEVRKDLDQLRQQLVVLP